MDRRITHSLFYIVLGLLLAAVPVRAMQIVYPADRTYVVKSDYLIVKTGDPEITGITIKVNGSESDLIDISDEVYRAAFEDIVILLPTWDPGANSVIVAGYKGENGERLVARETANIYYLASLSAYPPEGYEPFVMHLPERETLCAPCHNMNPSAAEFKADTEETSPCGSCHRRMFNKEKVHGPAGVWDCAYCHRRDSTPNKYRLTAAEAQLCNDCHADKTEEFKTNKFVHGPVGAGLCTVCHDPHASNHMAQLHDEPNRVCLACHEGLDKGTHAVRGVGGRAHPLQGPKNPLNPDQPFSCVSCHDPHGGEAQFLFVGGIKTNFALCQACHPK